MHEGDGCGLLCLETDLMTVTAAIGQCSSLCVFPVLFIVSRKVYLSTSRYGARMSGLTAQSWKTCCMDYFRSWSVI